MRSLITGRCQWNWTWLDLWRRTDVLIGRCRRCQWSWRCALDVVNRSLTAISCPLLVQHPSTGTVTVVYAVTTVSKFSTVTDRASFDMDLSFVDLITNGNECLILVNSLLYNNIRLHIIISSKAMATNLLFYSSQTNLLFTGWGI